MSLDTATVRRVAALARIRLEEEEVARVQGELNGILGWIEQLQAVNTDGIEPMAGGTPEGIAAMPLREDEFADDEDPITQLDLEELGLLTPGGKEDE